MSNAKTKLSDYDAIAGAVQHYIDGARAGKGDVMKLDSFVKTRFEEVPAI